LGALHHIADIFDRRLTSVGKSTDLPNEMKIVQEIRSAIPKGIILYNRQAEDTHNPLDRILDIYSYIDLKTIDPSISGIAKIIITCRFSVLNKTLSLRTINKNFSVE
jgi:hypothetical protein